MSINHQLHHSHMLLLSSLFNAMTLSATQGTLCTLSHPDAAVRLADGSGEAEGRVEVYIDGEWGTVCGDSWDPLDSKVVCQQLSYKGVNRTYSDTSQHSFGAGTGQSWLRGMLCTGSETNLLQCPHGGVGSGCSHSNDVGVVCTIEDLPGEGEWMWVRRREFQCTVHLISEVMHFCPKRASSLVENTKLYYSQMGPNSI